MTVAGSAAALTKAINDTTKALDITEASLDAKVEAMQASEAAAAADKVEAEGYRDEAAAHAVSAAADLTTVQGGVTYQGISAILAEKAVIATDVVIYDTRLDSDGGAWRKRCQHTSWYNEPLNTATRGARREFPAVAVIVAEPSGAITIYDGDDPALAMWMVLTWNVDPYRFSIAARNGILAIGNTYVPNAAYGGNGLALWSFPNAVLRRSLLNSSSSGWFAFYEGFTSRVTVRDGPINTTYGSDGSRREFSLVSYQINDIAMTVLPDTPIDPATGLPAPTIAVGTAGGTSIIKHDGTVVSDNTLNHNPYTSTVTFDDTGTLWMVAAGNHFFEWKAPYDAAGAPEINEYVPGRALAQWYGWIGAPVDFTAPTISERQIGHNQGLTRFAGNRHCFTASAWTTGWMPRSTRLVACADIARAELVAGGWKLDLTSYADMAAAEADGWVFVNNGVGESIITVDANGFDFYTSSSGNDTPFAYKAVSANDGQAYQITSDGLSLGAQARLAFQNNITGQTQGTLLFSFGTTTTTATDATMYLRIGGSNSTGGSARFTSLSVYGADLDRSPLRQSLIVNGTITRSPVAEGAELVGYLGFDFAATNYLSQPYNPALAFGTGDFCLMWWNRQTSIDVNRRLLGVYDPVGSRTRLGISVSVSGGMQVFLNNIAAINTGAGAVPAANAWDFFCLTRTGGVMALYRNGVAIASVTNTTTINTAATDEFRVGGLGGLGPDSHTFALLRISATAPTPDQVAKIYEDERKLFQPGAQCTLYGTSDAVKALAHDQGTNLLHVGTSAGRSTFDGLQRVAHTETPVSTAISAVNGLIAEQ